MAVNRVLIPRRTLLLGLAALICLTVLSCSTAPGHSPIDTDTDDSRLFFPGFSISEPNGAGWVQQSIVTEDVETSGGHTAVTTVIAYTKKMRLFHRGGAIVTSGGSGVGSAIPDEERLSLLESRAKESLVFLSADHIVRSFETSFEILFGTDCKRFDGVLGSDGVVGNAFEDIPGVIILSSFHGYVCFHPETDAMFAALYFEELLEGEVPSPRLKAEGEAFLRSIEIILDDVGGT